MQDSAVVRALASPNVAWPGSIPGPSVMWVEFIVGSRPCSEGFSVGSPVFLPPKKTNTSKLQFDWEFEGHRFVSHNTITCNPR